MKEKTKKLLDYIPLLILIASACYLLFSAITGNILLVWKHYVGLSLLLITTVLFSLRHLFGVLALGLLLIIGLTGLLSFSPAITTTTLGFGREDNSISLVSFQPIFLLWLIVYCTISGRYLVGIASTKYWIEVRQKKR